MALIVAAAIIDEAGRLLAARRDRGAYAGLWEFPGGKVEPGEDDQTALLRELREELGVTGTVGQRIGAAWPLEHGHTMHVYRVTLDPGAAPACLDGHDALRWLGGSQTTSVSWIAADLPILASVQHLLTD